MYSVVLQIDEEDQDPIIARMWERGTGGIVQKQDTLEAFFWDNSERAALLHEFAEWQPEIVDQPEIDWVARTQDSFPPVLVGERFFLVPPWNSNPAPPGRFRLEINPGLACGTGWHPCTRLCLRALEQYVRPGARVLDVGTGSGILSVAAGLLGASLVVGCDIDPEAVFVARERLASPFFIGSADAVRAGSFDVLSREHQRRRSGRSVRRLPSRSSPPDPLGLSGRPAIAGAGARNPRRR